MGFYCSFFYYCCHCCLTIYSLMENRKRRDPLYLNPCVMHLLLFTFFSVLLLFFLYFFLGFWVVILITPKVIVQLGIVELLLSLTRHSVSKKKKKPKRGQRQVLHTPTYQETNMSMHVCVCKHCIVLAFFASLFSPHFYHLLCLCHCCQCVESF